MPVHTSSEASALPESEPLPLEKVGPVRARIDALQEFVRKHCFPDSVPADVATRLAGLATQLDREMGRSASQVLGGLDTPPEEIDAECLTDPAVVQAMTQLEKGISAVRGRHSKQVDFRALGIST